MPSEALRLEEMGARAVVAKPFDPLALSARVQEILGTPSRVALYAAKAAGRNRVTTAPGA